MRAVDGDKLRRPKLPKELTELSERAPESESPFRATAGDSFGISLEDREREEDETKDEGGAEQRREDDRELECGEGLVSGPTRVDAECALSSLHTLVSLPEWVVSRVPFFCEGWFRYLEGDT